MIIMIIFFIIIAVILGDHIPWAADSLSHRLAQPLFCGARSTADRHGMLISHLSASSPRLFLHRRAQVDRLHFSSAAKVVVTVAGVEHASCRAEDHTTPTATATVTSKKSACKSVHEEASQEFWRCTALEVDGAVGAGVHTWPFSAVLPKDLPSNMMVGNVLRALGAIVSRNFKS